MREFAIRNIHPTVVQVDGEIVAKDSNGNIVVLDEPAIAIETARLQAEYDALQYQQDRRYPSIGDQLDMQYHDQLDGTTTWKDAVAKVKSDNPKPDGWKE